MNLEKLTPAPWEAILKTDTLHLTLPSYIGFADLRGPKGGTYRGVSFPFTNDEAAFIALARNAFDVMMRRGWSAHRHAAGTWFVDVPTRIPPDGASVRILAGDPFTALVEADKGYRENVEK